MKSSPTGVFVILDRYEQLREAIKLLSLFVKKNLDQKSGCLSSGAQVPLVPNKKGDLQEIAGAPRCVCGIVELPCFMALWPRSVAARQTEGARSSSNS